jgi:hypothetical protein
MHPHERVAEVRRLYATGLTAAETARLMSLPWSTVAHWCRGDRRSPTARRPDRSACPRCTDALLHEERYAYLLGQYLGDGHIVHSQRICRFSITCSDSWPGVRDEVEAAISAVLPTSSMSRRQRTGCTDVRSHSVHRLCLFPQHGPGMKHTRTITLEEWQQEIVDAHPGPFLRGLFHSDGCRITNWTRRRVAGEMKRYEDPRYSFSNKSTDILALCCVSLDQLGIAHRRPRWDQVSVARREAVAALDRWVGPKS